MSQSVVNAIAYWATQTPLTALIPANNVWTDVAADKVALPYVTFTQTDVKVKNVMGNHQMTWTTLEIKAFALLQATVDQIITQVQTSYVKQTGITPTQVGNGCTLVEVKEGVADGGAYVATAKIKIMEAV